jgi:hypothetical protein
MQLHEFKYQEKQRKKELLFENGVYLATRFIKNYQLLLYSVASFYVEVYFDYFEEEIGYMKAFSSTEELSPYLEMIDISALLSMKKEKGNC